MQYLVARNDGFTGTSSEMKGKEMSRDQNTKPATKVGSNCSRQGGVYVVHILKADGSKVVKRYRKEPGLRTMQKWVGGRIQCVRVPYDGRTCAMLVNEEGRLLNMPSNEQASAIYKAIWKPKVFPPGATVITLGPDEPVIVGDAAILTNFEL